MRSDKVYRILIVDDDPDMRALVIGILAAWRCEVIEAGDGVQGLSLAFTEQPDLILLDNSMPRMSGIEVVKRLRANLATRHLPALLLSAKDAVEDRVLGLEAGADDYIIKPFAPAELVARVQAALHRHRRDMSADPLTKLPGNRALHEDISGRLARGEGFSVAYLDLDHFKAYVDHYGFESASAVIQRLAQILYNVAVEAGRPEDFVGHIGGDDFLLVADSERAAELCAAVVDGFLARVPGFYGPDDVARGAIEGTDRYGVRRSFPLLRLSVAIIDVAGGASPDVGLLSLFAARCKSEVKRDAERRIRRFAYPG